MYIRYIYIGIGVESSTSQFWLCHGEDMDDIIQL